MDIENGRIISTDEEQLNLLFKELLEGCRDDLEESKINVEMFLNAIIDNKDFGKERFGELYNNALRIKGDARDRQLKLLNMFKDRVSTKEKIDLTRKVDSDNIGALPSPMEMNKYIEEIEKAKKSTVIDLGKPDDYKPVHEIENKVILNDLDDDDDDMDDYEIDLDE